MNLTGLGARLIAAAEETVKRVPYVRRRLRKELAARMRELEPTVKPYRGRFASFTRLPSEGRPREEVLREIEAMVAEERPNWQDGLVSGAVYHGDPEHIAFLARVAELESQANPLHSDLWPSIARFEAEIVAMTASLFGGDPSERDSDRRVVGTVTSGGTESILLAMKAYRDRARARGIAQPEIVAPVSAHVAFDKAAQYFGMRMRRVPVGTDLAADVAAVRRATSHRTAVIVASAPSFPHGVVDPVPALAELARARKVGLHVDACLGGFLLPFARKLGHALPAFDFGVEGVTSISADTHKYGYGSKGSSVVLYRGDELRSHQYFTATDWPGGLYFSPTFAGSRSGAPSAAAWAAMVALGEGGYLEATRRILDAAARARDAVRAVKGLRLLGNSLFVVAFGAEPDIDVYRVLDAMTHRGWNLNGLQRPPAVHLAVTLRHAQPGVIERFGADLAASVDEVRGSPPRKDGMAPIYGMAAALPFRGVVSDMLKAYLDLLYEP